MWHSCTTEMDNIGWEKGRWKIILFNRILCTVDTVLVWNHTCFSLSNIVGQKLCNTLQSPPKLWIFLLYVLLSFIKLYGNVSSYFLHLMFDFCRFQNECCFLCTPVDMFYSGAESVPTTEHESTRHSKKTLWTIGKPQSEWYQKFPGATKNNGKTVNFLCTISVNWLILENLPQEFQFKWFCIVPP